MSAKVIVTGHGIDTDFFSLTPKVHQGFKIVSVGRIAPTKNIHYMLAAVRIFSAKHPDVTLDVYGVPVTDSEKKYAASLTEDLHELPSSAITMHGAIRHDDIPQVLNTADAFLNMGTTGGIDKAVLEAMAVGIPVISSSGAHAPLLGTCPECVVTEDASDVVRALETLYVRSRADREKMGRELRTHVATEHALPQLVQKILWTLKNK